MRLRTIIALATVVPLLSIGAAVLPRHIEGRWQAMADWASKAEAEWKAHDFRRQPLWGTTVEGSAFAAYRDALEQGAVLGRNDAAIEAVLGLRAERATAADREAFLLRWRAALEAVGKGAHSGDARPDIVWRHGIAAQPINLLAGRYLQNTARLAARVAIERGDATAAVHTVLDAATFAVDLHASPLLVDRLIAAGLLQIAVGEALCDDDLLRLDTAARGALARGLEQLDERLTPALAVNVSGEALLNANTVLAGAPPGDSEPDPATAPRQARFAWSRRWAAADAVLALVAGNDRLQQAAARSWPERDELLATVQAEWEHSTNAMLARIAPPVRTMELSVRRAAVQLRLLRLLLAGLGDGDLPVIADPLGDGPLHVERSDSVVRVRSAGGGQAIERSLPRR